LEAFEYRYPVASAAITETAGIHAQDLDAAAGALRERRRVPRRRVPVEPLAIVFDGYQQTSAIQAQRTPDLLAWVGSAAMHHGVGQGLAQQQFGREALASIQDGLAPPSKCN
jgi:hypothetical protein